MVNKLDFDDAYYRRRSKAPTETSVVVLDNKNNIQAQIWLKGGNRKYLSRFIKEEWTKYLGYCLKKKGKFIKVTKNIGNVFPSSLNLKRAMPQNKKLIIQISWSSFSWYIQNLVLINIKYENNTTSNKTMALHKYMPYQPIIQFATSKKTSRRIYFE